MRVWNRNADGSIRDRNVSQDPRARRVERFNNFGNQLTKTAGLQLARQQMDADLAIAYVGTITLKVDAPERHRLELKAGMNILYRNFRGADHMFHVAQATVDPASMTVTADVDERARDWFAVKAILDRNREATDPTRRPTPTRRHTYFVNDVVPEWDCESGAGVIPTHVVAANTWTVVRIPAGRVGNIVRAEVTVSNNTAFSCAIFDAPITPVELHRQIPLGPLTETAGGQDPWDLFGGDAASGLIIAWGGPGQAAGYHPYRESDGAPATGKLVDNAPIYYESKQSPWLWWVTYPKATATISGRLFPQAVMF